mmetsp:Transcript_12031/g.15184  ORF Transcript_12031/g.15184 Transcript_12031/m.15184 type:complete len:266 (-) Transcript_12031:415-1212(-)
MGTFQGHVLPAAFFIGFSALFLCHTLYQAYHLPPGACLSDHVLDRKPSQFRKIAIFGLVATVIGILYEGLNGLFDISGDHGSNFFANITHEVLYIAFSFVTMIMIMESNRRVPQNSTRLALCVAFLVEYILWYGHALMKYGANLKVHVLLAQTCLVSSVVFLVAATYPKSVTAYVAGLCLMLLQGTWLIQAGINELDGHDLNMHQVDSFFCLHILAIAFVVSIATACVYTDTTGEGDILRAEKGGEQYEQVTVCTAVESEEEESA